MNIATVIAARRADTGALDPDTLHGLLLLEEQGADHARVAALLRIDPDELRNRLSGARHGAYGKVPPVNLDGGHDERGERLPGLFPRLWMRTILALMLRPDGVVTGEINDALDAAGRTQQCAAAVTTLKADLKVLGIDLESKPSAHGEYRRYRIVGRHNARLQKIIANGWCL